MDALKNLASLIKVKTIVTFAVVAVWMYLALNGVIEGETVNSVALMVISFYFGTQMEKAGK